MKPLHEKDLKERFVRSRGKGGQNVNKVSTCVILTHLPTGIMVRCDEARTQHQNRKLARERLAQKLEDRARQAALEKKHAAEKARRRYRKRSRRSKERMLQDKKHRAEIKKMRRPPSF